MNSLSSDVSSPFHPLLPRTSHTTSHHLQSVTALQTRVLHFCHSLRDHVTTRNVKTIVSSSRKVFAACLHAVYPSSNAFFSVRIATDAASETPCLKTSSPGQHPQASKMGFFSSIGRNRKSRRENSISGSLFSVDNDETGLDKRQAKALKFSQEEREFYESRNLPLPNVVPYRKGNSHEQELEQMGPPIPTIDRDSTGRFPMRRLSPVERGVQSRANSVSVAGFWP